MNVVTRIAPSPTGRMHIGTARTALFNYLWAKHTGGKFLLRIEDTDAARDKPEFEQDILDNLAWLGLTHDAFYRQSEHKQAHTEAIEKLIGQGNAYISKEPSRDDPSKTVELIRFKNPGSVVTFNDHIHGEVTVDTTDLKDFVIARSMTEPVHHLAVVVDDAAAGVTLAMRGEDLLSNTPRQILIQEALGLPRPEYAHLPLILAPDRTKLSKRKHATSIGDYKDKGYDSGAMVNFLAFLGWNPGTDEEVFSLSELVERFTLDQINKSGAIFNEEKLRWFNREHLLKVSEGQFAEESKKFFKPETLKKLEEVKRLDAALGMVRERIEIYSDITKMDEEGEFGYLTDTPSYEAEKLAWKQEGLSETKARLEAVLALVEALPEAPWSKETVKEKVWPYAELEGKGSVLWPMRYALTGRDKSPDPFEVAGILGKDETLARIQAAIDRL